MAQFYASVLRGVAVFSLAQLFYVLLEDFLLSTAFGSFILDMLNSGNLSSQPLSAVFPILCWCSFFDSPGLLRDSPVIYS